MKNSHGEYTEEPLHQTCIIFHYKSVCSRWARHAGLCRKGSTVSGFCQTNGLCVPWDTAEHNFIFHLFKKGFFNKIKNIRPPFSVYHTCIYLGSDLLLVFFSSKNIYIDNVLPFLLHLSLFEWLLFPVFFAIFSG